MQRYPVRTSHRGNLVPTALATVCQGHFDGAKVEGDSVQCHWGAIERLTARADGKELAVELVMNPKVDAATAQETIRRYNAFLEAATGFSSKERAKRLRKSAGA
ncbi:MAG: DUF5611 family protein [Thermoplasmata archaeon]|nr:DUF5611 family protein [Thermoplasmata archaeon]